MVTDPVVDRDWQGGWQLVAVVSSRHSGLLVSGRPVPIARLRAPAGTGYPEPVDIGPLNVAVASAVLSLVGWAVLAALERLTPHARRIWLVVALVGLAASLSAPLSGTGVSTANRGVLVLMHVAVAAVLIPVLYRTSPRRLAHLSQVPSTVTQGEAA